MPIKLPQESNPAPEDQKRNADDQFNRAMAKKRRLSTEPVEEEERPAPHRRLKYGTGQAQSPEQSAALRADRSEDDKRFAAALLRVMKLLPISMTPIDCPFGKDCPFSHKSVKAVAVHAAVKHLDKIHAFLRNTIGPSDGTNYLLRVCNVADARLYATLEKVLRNPLRCEPCNKSYFNEGALLKHQGSGSHKTKTGATRTEFKCPKLECDGCFDTVTSLQEHLLTFKHSTITDAELKLAADAYPGLDVSVVKKKHSNRFQCPGCKFSFENCSSLVSHMVIANHTVEVEEMDADTGIAAHMATPHGSRPGGGPRGKGANGPPISYVSFTSSTPAAFKLMCDNTGIQARGLRLYSLYQLKKDLDDAEKHAKVTSAAAASAQTTLAAARASQKAAVTAASQTSANTMVAEAEKAAEAAAKAASEAVAELAALKERQNVIKKNGKAAAETGGVYDIPAADSSVPDVIVLD